MNGLTAEKESPMLMMLPVKLTDQEMLMQADELAKSLGTLVNEKADAKDTAAAAKTRIGELESEVLRVARIVREKSEARSVECKEVQNFDRKTMDMVRLDTGEIVSYRPMRDDEAQVRLFSVEGDQTTITVRS